MLPSRGFAHISAQARIASHSPRLGYRSLSTRIQRPRTSYKPQRSQSSIYSLVSFRRNISWTPSAWSQSSWSPNLWIPQPHDLSSRPDGGNAPLPTSSASPSDPRSSPAASGETLPPDAPVAEIAPPTSNGSVSDLGSLDFSTVENVGDMLPGFVPEQIGFMKTLGIDFGWGPTSMIQWTLEHVHVYSGFPWWASIIVTALGSRAILLWAAVQSSDVAARMGALKPITQPVNDKMMAAYKTQDTQAVQEARTELQAIMKKANIRWSRLMLPLVAQGVIAWCALRLMRAMANLPVPGLKTGGALWFQDLTIADPTYILPLSMAASLHVLIRYGGENGANANMTPAVRTFLLYAMPVVVMVSMAWFPAAVVLWLATTGAAGIAQARALQHPGIREWLQIAPLITKPQDLGPAPKIESVIDVNSVTTPTQSPSSPQSTAQVRKPADPAKGLRYQAPKLKYAPSQQPEVPKPVIPTVAQPPTAPAAPKSLLSKPKDFLAGKANELGEAWEGVVDMAKSRAMAKKKTDNTIPQNRNLSKRQLEEAARYEREFQARKKSQQKSSR